MRPLIEDLEDLRFGSLVVLAKLKTTKGPSLWRCKCDCGKLLNLMRGHLTGKDKKERCSRDCPLNKGNKRTKERTCKYCNSTFLACDTKASVCPGCLSPVPCACGCGGIAKSKCHPFIPGHSSRITTEKMLEGRRSRSEKIMGENNPSKRSRVILSNALKEYWANLTTEERKERLKNNVLRNNPGITSKGIKRRKKNSGFQSSWEKLLADYFVANGVNQCLCHEINCHKGWHYEENRDFWDGRKYYPDFVYNGVVIEVVGASFILTPQRTIKKLLKIAMNGHLLAVVTDKSLLTNLENHYCPGTIFTLDKLDELLIFLKGNPDVDINDPVYGKDCVLQEIRDRLCA